MFIRVSERPRTGEYSDLTNAQICKLRWEKLKEKSSVFMLKEKIRKTKWRENIKKDPLNTKKYKADEKLRKRTATKTKQANALMTTKPNDENFSSKNQLNSK